MIGAEEIARRVAESLDRTFREANKEEWARSRTYRTRGIKIGLGNLGHELGFRVCCSGSPDSDEGEWLYDMSWCTLDDSKGGTLTSQPMVLECEWMPDPTVDTDFQKLVQARADVRVWIFTAANLQDVRAYIGRCNDQIASFPLSRQGDIYVFAAFEWFTRTFLAERFCYQGCGRKE